MIVPVIIALLVLALIGLGAYIYYDWKQDQDE